jgi:flagellar hook-basal body complex protein FliE
MADQIYGVGNTPNIQPIDSGASLGGIQKTSDGKDFKDLLIASIEEVNRLQAEATRARIDLASGRTDNVAEVFTSVRKAGIAFDLLMQIRNKLQEAYDEIKQIRV